MSRKARNVKTGSIADATVNPLTGENGDLRDFMHLKVGKLEAMHETSVNNEGYVALEQGVMRWLNLIFNHQGVIVRDIGDECSDGILVSRILKLVFKTDIDLIPTLTEANKRQNLELLFKTLEEVHGLRECDNYSQMLLYDGSSIAVIALLVDLFRSFAHPPFPMPTDDIVMAVVHQEKKADGSVSKKTKRFSIAKWEPVVEIADSSDLENDTVFKIFKTAPADFLKLQSLIVQLVNVQLGNEVIHQITDLEDGVVLEAVLNLMILKTSDIKPDVKERDPWSRCVKLWQSYLGAAFDASFKPNTFTLTRWMYYTILKYDNLK